MLGAELDMPAHTTCSYKYTVEVGKHNVAPAGVITTMKTSIIITGTYHIRAAFVVTRKISKIQIDF